MFKPLEEPDDPYGLNDEWYEAPPTWITLLMASIPGIGIGGVIGSYIMYRYEREENKFNLGEAARVATLLGVVVQTISIILWVVVL